MGGWVQCQVLPCCPHGRWLSSLGLGSQHSGRKPECLCCAELFPLTTRANSESSFGLRKPFGLNRLLVVCWGFFVQDLKVLFSDFELRESGVLFHC